MKPWRLPPDSSEFDCLVRKSATQERKLSVNSAKGMTGAGYVKGFQKHCDVAEFAIPIGLEQWFSTCGLATTPMGVAKWSFHGSHLWLITEGKLQLWRSNGSNIMVWWWPPPHEELYSRAAAFGRSRTTDLEHYQQFGLIWAISSSSCPPQTLKPARLKEWHAPGSGSRPVIGSLLDWIWHKMTSRLSASWQVIRSKVCIWCCRESKIPFLSAAYDGKLSRRIQL